MDFGRAFKRGNFLVYQYHVLRVCSDGQAEEVRKVCDDELHKEKEQERDIK